jgi:copper chaperone
MNSEGIMSMKRTSYKIVGMYCVTCKLIVEKLLKDEEAVKRIDVVYMTESVVVEFDSLITKGEIKNRLEGQFFTVTQYNF